jgi:hypothetical protein
MTRRSAKVARSWDDDLDRGADCGDHERGQHDPAPEPERAADRRHQRVGDVGPEHVERAMRDIDDARDAEDEGEPGRDEEQARCRSETIEGLKGEAGKTHEASLAKDRGPVIGPGASCP